MLLLRFLQEMHMMNEDHLHLVCGIKLGQGKNGLQARCCVMVDCTLR